MTTVQKFAQTIKQTTGNYTSGSNPKKYRSWSNLNNLKAGTSVATCSDLGGKNGTYPRPAPLTLSSFGFNIPSTAKVTKVTVYYTHQNHKVSGAYGSFTAPTLNLLNLGTSAKKGSGVPKTATQYSLTWTGSWSASKVNSSSFGVTINYPANSNTNPAKITLKNVRVVVEYTNVVTGVTTTTSSTSTSTQSRISSAYAGVSKSVVLIGETTEVTLTVSATSNITASTTVEFNLPTGLNFMGKTRGNGSITDSDDTISSGSSSSYRFSWVANFSNTNKVSISFKVMPTSAGQKTITVHETTTNKLSYLTITGKNPEVNLGFTGDDVFLQGSTGNLDLVVSCDNFVEDQIVVTFPGSLDATVNIVGIDEGDYTTDGVEINGNTISGTVSTETIPTRDGNTFTIPVTLIKMTKTIRFSVNFTNVISATVIVSESNDNKTITKNIKVKPATLSIPYHSKLRVSDEVLDRMGNSKLYTVSTYMKVITEDENLFETYDQNYRIGVFNTELPVDATDEYIFENTVWSQSIVNPNTWEELEVNFYYSEDYPLIILICGEYIENNAEYMDVQHTYPCLMENSESLSKELPGLFPYPIKKICTMEELCSVIVPHGKESNTVKLYDLDASNFIDEEEEENKVIQGVSLIFDMVTCDNPISILAKLTGTLLTKEGSRSINIETEFLTIEEGSVYSGEVTLGGSFDLWGLGYDDFKLSNIQDLEIELEFLNNFSEDVNLEFNNLRLVFHYVEISESKIQSKVNGVDLRNLNVFIQNVKVPAGTKNDVKYLEVEGTDSNLAYRSNIQGKTIEIDILVPGCDIEETTAFVERLALLFSNKRDKFNKPSLNSIEFNHYPNRVWYFILEDGLEDLDVEFCDYEGTIKLYVPEGVSFSKEPVVTNASGTISGIAKVNPILRVIATGSTVMITETYSNQTWKIYNTNISSGDLLRIDCAKRKVYKVNSVDDEYDDSDDQPDTDITNDGVDFNSDWFLIQNEYNFDAGGTADIQSVTFYEKW